jgi:tetratricopeptide (TPR) repeat protein
MSENQPKKKLNFDLPQPKEKSAFRSSKLIIGLLVLILLAVCANILVSLEQGGPDVQANQTTFLEADQQKNLALKLEKQGLFNASADAWKEYLQVAQTDDKETALIWYRIGKLFQDNNAWENALASYYRSERIAPVDSIASEIAIRIQECLESMGKFAAMRHELIDRVSMDPTGNDSESKDKILAEIGTEKISAADLDRHIEANIEQQMRLMAPTLPEDERLKQKETLLKQMSSPDTRKMFLNQYIVEEILYRKARQDNLTKDPQVRDLIQHQERSLLSRLFLEKEYENRINITLSDLKTYFEANKDKFQTDDKEVTFDNVQNEVYQTLRSQKEKEIQQQLLAKLKDDFDVVIHQSALLPEEPSKNN